MTNSLLIINLNMFLHTQFYKTCKLALYFLSLTLCNDFATLPSISNFKKSFFCWGKFANVCFVHNKLVGQFQRLIQHTLTGTRPNLLAYHKHQYWRAFDWKTGKRAQGRGEGRRGTFSDINLKAAAAAGQHSKRRLLGPIYCHQHHVLHPVNCLKRQQQQEIEGTAI